MNVAGLLRGFGSRGVGLAPAEPLLLIDDDETGASATATVIGASEETVNTISVQNVSDGLGGVWMPKAVIAENGETTLLLAPGFYWGRVVSRRDGAASLGNLVYFSVTSGMDAILIKILDALIAKIQGLNLDGVDSASVVKRKLPWDKNVTLPAVILSPMPEAVNPQAGTNERDDVDYRIIVSLTRVSNQNVDEELNWMARARERIRSSLHNQPLTVSGVSAWRCTVEPGTVYIPESFASGYDTGYLIARVTSREARNL